MSATAAIAASEITGLVLAGGRGSRQGGGDNGVQNLNGHATGAACGAAAGPAGRPGAGERQSQPGRLRILRRAGLARRAGRLCRSAGRFPDRAGTLRDALASDRPVRHPAVPARPGQPPGGRHASGRRRRHRDGQRARGRGRARRRGGAVPAAGVLHLLRAALLDSLVRFTQDGGRKDRQVDRPAPHRAGAPSIAPATPSTPSSTMLPTRWPSCTRSSASVRDTPRMSRIAEEIAAAALAASYDPKALGVDAVQAFLDAAGRAGDRHPRIRAPGPARCVRARCWRPRTSSPRSACRRTTSSAMDGFRFRRRAARGRKPSDTTLSPAGWSAPPWPVPPGAARRAPAMPSRS